MRTLLLAILIWAAVGSAGAAPINTPPPIVFSVQPEEDGKLVYLRIVRETPSDPASNLFGLRVGIANNSTNDIRLNNIRIVFTYADNAMTARQFARDLTIAANSDAADYLTPDESIQLPQTAPVSAEVQLFCDGYALPKTLTRQLAAYQAPTPSGSYLFPGSDSDLGPDEYWSHVDPHTGGDQFFGYDFHLQKWNGQNFSSVNPGGDSSKNEDRVGWNIPIYAMADGVVMRTTTGIEDNPAPGKRVIQRMDDYDGAAISDVKVTRLKNDRMASVARLASGNLEVTAWNLEDVGRQIIKKDSVQGEAVDLIAADALTSTRLITAVRAGGNLRLIAWDVLNDGATVNRLGDEDAGPVSELSIARLSNSRFATAVRAARDTFRLTIWQTTNGVTFDILSETNAGAASSVSIVALSGTRLATPLRASDGTLKVIIWELLDDGATIDRRGEATGAAITTVTASKFSATQLDTAVKTAGGDLQLVRWLVSDDGESVTQELEVSAGQIQGVSMVAPGFDDAVITTVITDSGNLKNILWIPDDGGTSFKRWGESDAGAITTVSIDQVNGGLFLSGVRQSNGDLKLIAWFIGSGGGNNFVILHGNCRMLYAHMRDGSVNQAIAYPGAIVKAGQFLGRMGNSGSSAGPHLHVHASRVSSLLTVEEVIALEASDQLQLQGYRPIPFHCARARRLNSVQQGDDPASAFSLMQGHGVYFAQFAIRPSWFKEMYVDWSSECLIPSGRLQCWGIFPLFFGGPYLMVNDALTSPACEVDQLFIRGGTYDENVTFSRPMTVRSYDGTAVIR